MKHIIIDTDGNIEAMEALKYALSLPSVTIDAVTTTGSGLSPDEAVSNVLTVLKEAGARNFRVFKGAGSPVAGRACRLTLPSHKLLGDGLLHTDEQAPAANALIELVSSSNVELIAMGPLTNVALAFVKDREAMSKLRSLSLLSGMVFHGDVGPMSEYNIFMDPYGADIVLRSKVPITILPIETGKYVKRMELALFPEAVKSCLRSYTRIETNGTITYGASINDVRDRSRKEFISQTTVMHPFNCTLVLDGAEEEITMEA